MSRKQLQPVLKLLLIGGLSSLALLGLLSQREKNRMNVINRLRLWLSPYRKLSSYLVAMAKHETGEFTSQVYNRDNNLFGLKIPSKREWLGTPGTEASDGGNFSHYSNDGKSLKDLFLYFDFVHFPKAVGGLDQFVTELKERGYFTDSWENYHRGLKRFL